jgi:hypothetical protein
VKCSTYSFTRPSQTYSHTVVSAGQSVCCSRKNQAAHELPGVTREAAPYWGCLTKISPWNSSGHHAYYIEAKTTNS